MITIIKNKKNCMMNISCLYEWCVLKFRRDSKYSSYFDCTKKNGWEVIAYTYILRIYSPFSHQYFPIRIGRLFVFNLHNSLNLCKSIHLYRHTHIYVCLILSMLCMIECSLSNFFSPIKYFEMANANVHIFILNFDYSHAFVVHNAMDDAFSLKLST